MLKVTNDLMMPTGITGSYPRPLWFTESLRGRSFKAALGDALFREQYMDAVACIINAREAAGLDIVTDGDSRFDLAVGGKSWFFYPIERLGGVEGHRDTSRGWMQRHGLRPGRILWEGQEAYQPGVVRGTLTRGPLEYTALWKVAQRLTDKPLKLGAICAPERALPSLLQLDGDVITFECASSDGRDLPLFAKYRTNKKIAIGVVNHCNTVVEPPEHAARLIRKALEYIPPERLVITTDCGFGREGLSRRIAYYKCVALVEGTNIVRRELGLPEARVRAADPTLYFASGAE